MDYEDFLRQNHYSLWEKSDIRRNELIAERINTADQFAFWVRRIAVLDEEPISAIAANGVLILLNVTCVLLARQIDAQATAFQKEGGFTERLYKIRTTSRNKDLK